MPQDLSGKKIAIVATDGFGQSELTEPRRALDEAGATTHVIAPQERQDPRLAAHEVGRRGVGRPDSRRGRCRRL
jgi:putative intracellular protease/amidase